MFNFKSRKMQIHPLIGFSIGMLYMVSIVIHFLGPKYGVEQQVTDAFGVLSLFLLPVFLFIRFAPPMKKWIEVKLNRIQFTDEDREAAFRTLSADRARKSNRKRRTTSTTRN